MGAEELEGKAELGEAMRVASTSLEGFDWIGHPDFARLAGDLAAYERHTTVATLAGLLTVPTYQTASLRLELLLHLALSHCNGRLRATKRALTRWVNETLAALPLHHMEDPAEDVFVSNAITGGGNYRLFEGLWEANDFHLQLLLDLVYLTPAWRDDWQLRARIEGLLTLGDAAASRALLERWETTRYQSPRPDILRRIPDLASLRARVSFTEDSLRDLGVPLSALEPFMADPSAFRALPSHSVRSSPLLRRPLARFGRDIVLLSPAAVGMAVRHEILAVASTTGRLPQLQHAFDRHQTVLLMDQVYERLALQSEHPPPAPVEVSHMDAPRPIASFAFVPFDRDKVAHVVLLTDDLADVHRAGVASHVVLPAEVAQGLAAHLQAGAQAIHASGATGLTCLVVGGLGRGMSLSIPGGDTGLPADWPIIDISLSDIHALASREGASLLRLWKLEAQALEARRAGITVVNHHGALNLYAFWERQGFALAPADMPWPQAHGVILLQADFLYDLRVAARRLTDLHAAPLTPHGERLRVRRLHEWPFFVSSSHRPIYAVDDFVPHPALAGVVEYHDLVVWVCAERPQAPRARDLLYRIWGALLAWLDRLAPSLQHLVVTQLDSERAHHAQRSGRRPPVVRRLRLELQGEHAWASDAVPAETPPAERPLVSLPDRPDDDAIIHLPAGFLTLLNQPANVGERALLEEVAVALASSWSEPLPLSTSPAVASLRGRVADVVTACMGGPDAREVHVWHTTNPFHQNTAHDLDAPRFVQAEDSSSWQLGLGARLGVAPGSRSPSVCPSDNEPRGTVAIEGLSESRHFLHRLVDYIWGELRARLQTLHAPELLTMLARNVEAIFEDREHWRRTARAVRALHRSEDVPAISSHREAARAAASTASRVLMEMALCTSLPAGGRRPSLCDMDWLVAGTALLLEAAANADAIRGGLGVPRVVIAPNGRVHTERSDLDDLVLRYGRDTHADDFRAAAGAYEDLFRSSSGSSSDLAGATASARATRRLPARWDERFQRAYRAEFGITLDHLIDAFAELLDVAADRGRVVVTTRGELTDRLRAARGFSTDDVKAFLSATALEPRARWDETPDGFTQRDWEPWRFRRRLSVSARPLMVLGRDDDAPCIYGVAQAGASLSYVLEGVRSAWFPSEYFRSTEMRKYRGTMADELGVAFEREVADHCFRSGWTVQRSVLMAALGAPSSLGDIDVLAWRPNDRIIWLIECKRLQPTRTVSEIVERLRQFRGESNDLLAKHMRRHEWVRTNIDKVRERLQLPHSINEVQVILATSSRMPMQYAAGMPLSPGHVVSVEDLVPLLASLAH